MTRIFPRAAPAASKVARARMATTALQRFKPYVTTVISCHRERISV